MKGFLLLSLCLLLVISGSSSQSSTSPSSSSVGPSPSTSSSSQITVTSQTSGGPGSSSVGPTPSTGSSSQTTVTSQTSGGPGSSSVGPTPFTGSSSQTSGGPGSSSVGPTPSTGSSSQTSGGPGSSSVGPTPFTGSSSQTSGGASSSTVTSTGPSDPCQPNPCQGSASCVKLHNSSFCLCVEGYYYNESSSPSCVKGKTFPGEISMDVSETDGLDDENSENYQKLHNDVVDFFATVFSKTDYGQTVILKVGTAPSMSARSAIPVYVSLVNMFREDTDEIEYTVSLAIHNAIENNDNVKSYFSQNLCDYYGCVRNGSSCEDGLQCTCKPGFDRLNPQVPFCVAVPCSESCNAKDKKQCIRKDNGAMECVCMPDYQKASGNGNCEECPFGYSGMDCKDPFQLILTIVGTVAGALILILLIACIVSVRSKNKKKDVEEQKLIEDDFQNLRLRQTGFSNYGADNSIFPKVRTGVTSQTPNPYTNQRSMPRPDY